MDFFWYNFLKRKSKLSRKIELKKKTPKWNNSLLTKMWDTFTQIWLFLLFRVVLHNLCILSFFTYTKKFQIFHQLFSFLRLKYFSQLTGLLFFYFFGSLLRHRSLRNGLIVDDFVCSMWIKSTQSVFDYKPIYIIKASNVFTPKYYKTHHFWW